MSNGYSILERATTVICAFHSPLRRKERYFTILKIIGIKVRAYVTQ